MIEGWQPKSRSLHLTFGGLYASGVERYAHHRAAGLDHDQSTDLMVKWVLENSGEYVCEECGTEILADDNGVEYCPSGHNAPHVWTPWESNDEYKNRYTLIRSLVWNVEERKDSNWTTVILSSGKPAVELSFNFVAFTLEGEEISLSGHMDEVLTNTGSEWVKDDKTTKSALTAYYAQQWTPNNQMSLYSVAGKVVRGKSISGVLIRAAQIGVGFTRFATFQAPRPPAILDEWMGDLKVWVNIARQYAIANHWPMNDTACNDYGGCPFQKVCAVSPSHRKSWLENDFVKREWNPLDSRGDI